MDMAIANLFKIKLPFRPCGHDTDWDEPYLPNKGYHYVSKTIENAESVGIRSACDLYIGKLKPMFMYIISTMFHEAEMEVGSATITVNIVECEGEFDQYEIVKYEFASASPGDNITNYTSWVYPFPEELFRKKFSIYVEAYVYYVDDNVRALNAYYEEQSRLAEEEERSCVNELPPPEETFREDKCVICLESTPSILFLECGHIALCEECEKRKRYSNLPGSCDVCRAPVSRKLRI